MLNCAAKRVSEEAGRLKFFRRYRDDFTSLNIDNFMILAGEIYPPSLSLTQETRIEVKWMCQICISVQQGDGNYKDLLQGGCISVLCYFPSFLGTAICYRTFYGQTIRFEHLCTHRADSEDRMRFLMGILKDRNYDVKLLGRQFCQAVERYILVFQRWEIPVNLGDWFK